MVIRNTNRNNLGLNGLIDRSIKEFAGYIDEPTPCFNTRNDKGHLNYPSSINAFNSVSSPLTPTSPSNPNPRLRMPLVRRKSSFVKI